MEKHIRILYLITIIAILAFLGMQGYWLYNRYGFALKEYEHALSEKIAGCVEEYNNIRRVSSDNRYTNGGKNFTEDVFTVPTFALKQEYGDTVKTTRTATISTYLFSAHKLLGLEPGTPLTSEQKDKALKLAQVQLATPADSVVFDASGAKDENVAWTATQSVQTEQKCRFTTEGIDSILNKAGIKALTMLQKNDSMVWNTTVDYHRSSFSPEISMTIPYSQLQGLTVNIVSKINPLDILPGMWPTLVFTVLISTLLIICLLLQCATVVKLSRLDRMRNSFLTTMIHELKRPLSTLKMCVSAWGNERMMNDDETRSEIISESRTALDNLCAYFSKLRDITFNNVEQIPLNLQTLNLYDLFENVSATAVIPPDKSVIFNNHINKSLEITADPTHLHSVLNNLVENAIKYSGDAVEITASATEKAGIVSILVNDTGNGISPTDLKHIFKRFYRGKASAGEQPGMGLGLTYVKLLIDAHGGDISLESTEGSGSCFTIKLPQ